MAPFKRLTNKVMINKGKEMEREEKEEAWAETEREEEKEMVLERLERLLYNQMEKGWMSVYTKRCSPVKERGKRGAFWGPFLISLTKNTWFSLKQ